MECAADVLDELVVPPCPNVLASCRDDGWFRCVPEAVAADAEDASSSEADAQDADDIGEVAAAGREDDEALSKVELRGLVLIQQHRGSSYQDERKRDVQEQRQDERQPPADVLLSVCGGNLHKAANVDKEVKPQHGTLRGSLRVDNDPLAALQHLDLSSVARHLVEQQGRHIWLEHGCGR